MCLLTYGQHERKLCFSFLIRVETFFSRAQMCPGSVHDLPTNAGRLR